MGTAGLGFAAEGAACTLRATPVPFGKPLA
jgi:hypothetical protein